MRLLFVAVLFVGCATAEKGNNNIGGRPDGGRPDSSNPLVDAAPPIDVPPPVDAPPGMQQITLSQTTNNIVASNMAIACARTDGFATRDNNWYRVFRLSDYNITSTFHVQRVEFAIDYADSLDGSQPIQVKIGTYTGTVDAATLNPAQITPVGSQIVNVPNGDSATAVPPPGVATFNNNIAPNANLIVEVDAPDGNAALDLFYIGVSTGGESHPGYISSTACTVAPPKTLVSLPSNNHVLITVTGTY